MTFKDWIIELFKDERGSTSIKPVIAILGAICLCVTLVLNISSKNSLTPADNIVNAIMVITAVGMGADSIDKFTKKSPSAPLEPPVDPK